MKSSDNASSMFLQKLKAIPLFYTFSLFELSLGAIGLVLGVFFYTEWNWTFAYADLISVYLLFAPLMAFAVFATSSWGLSIPGLQKIYTEINASFMGRFIRESKTWQLFVVSLCAGWGEEVLFRGFLQSELGWVWASIIFGLAHALTATYALLATVMGGYLGWIFHEFNQSIWIPALVHGIYDFAALLLYRRLIRRDTTLES